MKTVTDYFVTAQKQPDAIGYRTLEYKRRYWDQATRKFVWESAWTTLDDVSIVSVSPVSNQLDTDILNEFKVSNVTLILDNDFGYFNLDNPDGFFGQDSNSPNYLYEPYWTKFRVNSGFNISTGGHETVVLFVGLSDEFIYDSDQKTVQINLQGMESLLLNSKAENYGTPITQETVGTGNGVLVDFVTLNPGVGEVSLVTIDHLTKIEGPDYSVSDLNDATVGAKITFVNPPDTGKVVRVTYLYWPQNLQFNDVVEGLLESAGITDYDVSPIIFENSVINAKEFTSGADWGTGTLTEAAIIVLNSLQFDIANKIIGQTLGNPSDYTFIGNIPLQNQQWSFAYPITLARDGTLNNLSFKLGWFVNHGVTVTWRVMVWNNSSGSPGTAIYTGGTNSVTYPSGNSVPNDQVVNETVNLSLTAGTYWFGIEQVNTVGTESFTFKAVTASGGVPKIKNIGNPWAAYSTFGTGGWGTPSNTDSVSWTFSQLFSQLGSWTSPTVDLITTPTSYGTAEYHEDRGTPGLVIIYETRSSADGTTWDAWVPLSSQNVPQSALKRYLQIRIRIELTAVLFSVNPQVDDFKLTWTTESTSVVLPAFTGISVYEAIQKIGEFTNYEFGFDNNERFFFRPKSVGSSVIELSEDDYNVKITGMESGYARVYGTVRATYGAIVREVTDDAQFPESPNARVSDKRFEISPDASIQVSPLADIASGIAKSLFLYFSKRKRRFKLMTKYLPQLDLSDVVTVRLINNNEPKMWYLGDNDFNFGDNSIILWGGKNQLAFEMPAKIIGSRQDTERYTSEFDLEEITI